MDRHPLGKHSGAGLTFIAVLGRFSDGPPSTREEVLDISKIESATPKDDYCLAVMFDNGVIVTVDFKSKLHTVRFSLLSDKDYFNTVTTDGAFVRWNYKIEISVSEVLELAQKQA